VLGYGAAPAVAALSVVFFPVIEATVTGLRGARRCPRRGDGNGLRATGRLMAIELPLAFPFILAGLRNAVIINIGTAAIGSRRRFIVGFAHHQGLSRRTRRMSWKVPPSSRCSPWRWIAVSPGSRISRPGECSANQACFSAIGKDGDVKSPLFRSRWSQFVHAEEILAVGPNAARRHPAEQEIS
jgi:hypothetical protein